MDTIVMIGTATQTSVTWRHAINDPISVISNMPNVAAMPAVVVNGPRIDGSLVQETN